jgi:small-conductance mechanosensitive channel
MSGELKLKGTSFEDVLAECEKDPKFRREYLRVTMDETKELILENNTLRKQLEETNNQLGNAIRNTIHWKNEVSVEVKVKVKLEKQLEVAMEALKFYGRQGGSQSCWTYVNTKTADNALAKIERIGGEK